MKKWSDIEIKTHDWANIMEQVKAHENDNPACILGPYWKNRMTPKMWKKVEKTGRLVYGFVGDGWPQYSDQHYALSHDIFNLTPAFPEHHCRDIGDAIYQANTLIKYLPDNERLYIIDIGSGYGRLAIPFIYHYRGKITYIGIDYSPIGLLCAGQFVEQAVNAKVLYWNETGNFNEYDFVSLPAWRLDEIKNIPVNCSITVHSIQEMERVTVDYYIDLIDKISAPDGLFYSINLWPEDKYVKDNWQPVFDRAFPINRDGAFNEKLFRVKEGAIL